MRKFNVINGSKSFFRNKIKEIKDAKNFSDLVTLNDTCHKTGRLFTDQEKAINLIVKNDDYLGITESANDRLDALILEFTFNDSIIWLHNPSSKLLFLLNEFKENGDIELEIETQNYEIERNKAHYIQGIKNLQETIIGQDDAILEVSKSLLYLTSARRKKPYVIMLYGNSSIGKTEMVKAIAKSFFDTKVLEKHMSMYRSAVNSAYLFGDMPNRRSIGFDLLERESNLIFLDEFDKCADSFYSVFYTLFDNTVFKDAVYEVDISGAVIILTSNYLNGEEMQNHLGMPIYYRIDKFIHFQDFDEKTIFKIVNKELDDKYDEYKDYFTKDEIYSIVSKIILSKGENARTIKNKIQSVLENALFSKMLKSDF